GTGQDTHHNQGDQQFHQGKSGVSMAHGTDLPPKENGTIRSFRHEPRGSRRSAVTRCMLF
ncbi:MAG: hypothetical protein NUV77_20665, partial [Thermoguttaceae bacterium]|nr:hypothetical protein [Thermoguttaceae bacterium]